MDDNDRQNEKVSSGGFSIFLKKMPFLSRIFSKLKRIFKIRLVVDQKIEVNNNLLIQGLRLPYTLRELNRLGKVAKGRLDKAILKVCAEHSITRCIIPADSNCFLKNCVKSGFEGKIIYTALVEYILTDLCMKQGLSVREVDIAVVQGEDELMPYFAIKLLSPVVKFITLVTNQKELMESKIEQVCDETGLSVRITDNLEGVLESCDFIINYGSLNRNGIKNNINSNAIVINYGELDDTLLELKKPVVGGIDIGLGNKYLQGFRKEIFKFYSSTEIAEIVLTNKTDKSINNFNGLVDYMTVDYLKKHFFEEKFYIRGYL